MAAGSDIEFFRPGVMVLISLQSPREKYWGGLLGLSGSGVAFRGILLESFDDFIQQIRGGEAVTPLVAFFPMHRVERIELDQPIGDIQSMSESFRTKTQLSVEEIFLPGGAR
jgi:hypothetical protein